MTMQHSSDMARLAQLEQRVRALEDVNAIRHLKARYGAYCDDQYNAEGIAALFTEDAVWESQGLGRFEGRDAIREFFRGASQLFTFAIHYSLNGRIDVLVNNAGYTKFVPMKDLDGMPEAEWERTFDVNVKGIWLCTKAAVPAMRRVGGGVVLNVTSVAGLKVGGSSMAYAVSKAAAIHLTRCLAFALAPEIRVNAVAPALVVTRWWAHASAEQLGQMRASFPLQRSIEPEEVATAALELIRNDAMTGQTLAQDAGLLLV